MAETKAPQENRTYDEHPLYRAAMKRLAAGDDAGAVDKLRRLAQLYPQERAIQDQIVRIELRATLASQEPPAPDRGQPTPILRTIVLALFALTACIVLVASFALIYDRFVQPLGQVGAPGRQLETMRQKGQQRLEAGDWVGAREVFEAILTETPGDPAAQAALEQIEQQEALAQRYVDALSAQKQGDWQTALSILSEIQSASPGYRDVPQRIEQLQELKELEATWNQAQSLIQAGDLTGALSALVQIRTRNPEFRRSDVEEQLYQIYISLANGQIAQANGDPEALRQAVGYLDQALALRPADYDLIEERRLAVEFVAGFEAANQGDWASAATHWESVQTARPDYQGGVLDGLLRDAYPRAARQLIAEANGSVPLLRRAIAYLDQVLLWQPDNQELAQERQWAADYVAGAEALNENAWDLAIAHWGPIYAVHPAYQNGRLEELLRIACANSAAHSSLCPP